jgi:hypothetical protein
MTGPLKRTLRRGRHSEFGTRSNVAGEGEVFMFGAESWRTEERRIFQMAKRATGGSVKASPRGGGKTKSAGTTARSTGAGKSKKAKAREHIRKSSGAGRAKSG